MYKPNAYFPESAFMPSRAFSAWLDLWCNRMQHERMTVADLMAMHGRMNAERAQRLARRLAK